MSIKYYQLAKDEELPDEFCAVRDVGGEPSEYTFYVPEDENTNLRERITTQKQTIESYRDESREWREVADHAQVENAKLRGQYEAAIDDYRSEVAKLRELCGYLLPFAKSCGAEHPLMRELGIEVDE